MTGTLAQHGAQMGSLESFFMACGEGASSCAHHAMTSLIQLGNGPTNQDGGLGQNTGGYQPYQGGSTYSAPNMNNPLHQPSLPHAPAANIAWNAYRYIGDFLHLFGMLVMVLTLFKNQSLTGFSIKTSIIYLVLYVSRYLDLFTRSLSMYLTVFKCSYITLSSVPVVLFFKWDGYGYERRKDTVNVFALFLGCFILGIFTADHMHFVSVMWTFSQYLEAVALIPQYVFCYREPDKSEPGIVLFIVAIGFYRVFYACNWIYKKIAVAHYSDVHSWIAGFVEILFFADFLLHHFKGLSFLKNAVLGVDNTMRTVSDTIEFQVLGTSSQQRDKDSSIKNRLGGYSDLPTYTDEPSL